MRSQRASPVFTGNLTPDLHTTLRGSQAQVRSDDAHGTTGRIDHGIEGVAWLARSHGEIDVHLAGDQIA